ncbi:MAG TPA: DUF1499 domain-containing protein [Coleofasciculaceae cyanobacterium]|jgi:uncharacterized protein (DUF1499 family)
MLKSGLTFFFAIFFILAGWLNLETAIAAPLSLSISPSSTAPTLGIAMGSKSLFSFSGKRPTDLGVKAGRLASCPDSPNCVNSQSPQSDSEHQIAAIAYKSPATALSHLKSVIESMDRTQIISATDDYLYAEFTSGLMGFVDDVEFYLDSGAGVLQVRSASRLGKSDLGVNRKRIEEIRSKFVALDT